MRKMIQRAKGLSEKHLDGVIVFLFFLGVILMPMHLRTPLLKDRISFPMINYPCVLAALLTFFRVRKWGKAEIICAILWILMLIPMVISDQGNKRLIPAICQNLLPLAFLLYHVNEDHGKAALKWFVRCFDVFMLLFLALGVVEQTCDHPVLKAEIEWLQGLGLTPSELVLYARDYRFGSLWGHPLTASLLFNVFFAVNLVYDRSVGRRCPVLVYFVISLSGVLLASSKTGIIICVLMMIAASWKQKKWFLLSVPVLVLFYFTGLFDGIILRFQTSTLTTGRLEALIPYLDSGINPFKWLSGYGTNEIFSSRSAAYQFRAGMEFPELMYAYDYGILFSLIVMIGAYAYCTWRFLRQRKWLQWVCYSLIFAQISSYNGYALRNQDVCILINFCAMIMLNAAGLSKESAGIPIKENGLKQIV